MWKKMLNFCESIWDENIVYVMFYILVLFWLYRMECKGNMMKLYFYVFIFVNNIIEKIDNDNVIISEFFYKIYFGKSNVYVYM